MAKQTKKNDKPARSEAEIYQDVTDRILAALESGVAPWVKGWSGGWSNAPRNGLTNRPYSGINTWLLAVEAMLNGYQDQRWLTFNQAKQAGGTVKKDEKSTAVILWKPFLIKATDKNGNPVKDKNGRQKVYTKLYIREFRVFNVSQTEGCKLPERPKVEAPEPLEAAETIVNEYLEREGLTNSIAWGSDKACYYPQLDRFEMPAREQFTNVEHFYSTMYHELTHSTLHEKRLNRKAECEAGTHGFGAPKYGEEELCAEFGAAMLCMQAGIENAIDNSAAYVQSWKQAIKADNHLVVVAAGRAAKAFEYILHGPQQAKQGEGEDDGTPAAEAGAGAGQGAVAA